MSNSVDGVEPDGGSSATSVTHRQHVELSAFMNGLLESRVDHVLCPEDWADLKQAEALGGVWPDRVTACRRCGLVFRTTRAGVTGCAQCNRSRNAPPLWRRVDHPDGAGWSYATIFEVIHWRTCAACSHEFIAGTSTTLYCCSACKKAGSRGRKRRNPLAEVAALYMAEAERYQQGEPRDALAAAANERGPRPKLTAEELMEEVCLQRARGRRAA